MSTSFPATNSVQSFSGSQNRTLDWRYPFWTLTMALVFAGAISVLRMVFAGPLKWAETFGLIAIFCWRYWAYATGLFPSRFNSYRFRLPSLPQALLNGFAWFVFYLVLLTWTGNLPTSFTWKLAALGALACALLSGGRSGSSSTSPPATSSVSS